MPGSFGEQDSKFSVGHEEYPTPPCYISSRSADVILSDVRPTKLSPEALNSINALLDELLHTILSVARALTTTQLRAGLHKVLPTTLGKEAVLEAELELRAYWERTGGAPGSGSSQVVVDDSTFNLQWTFELLRLKCEAYSTLSDTDENPEAEARLFERMNAEGIPPPKQSLLAPASLYLTAIIESICEHIVSNVGRVAARDSSRAIANSQDLFIALCEDSSIYGPFRNMGVYGQIETLSKMPRIRRSMSISRENGAPIPAPAESFRRNGSINGSRRKMSSESLNSSPGMVANSTTQQSRPSSEKARAVKIFNSRVSQDVLNGTEPQTGHRKVDSFASANTKQSVLSKGDRSPISPTFSEDTRSQEFDDMMKSGSTMKVSLTPDRLRTMEVLNKEKARANGRHKTTAKTEKPNSTDIPPSVPSLDQAARGGKPTSTVRRIGSTIGNEEDRVTQKPPPTSRPRQLSAATASGYTVPSLSRVRTSSTTDPVPPIMPPQNKSSLSESNPPPSDRSSASGSIPRRKAPPQELDINATRPPRTRTVARNRESLDLDDIMGDSGDEDIGGLRPPIPSNHSRQRGLSASARELIDFLAEGPPETTPNENSLSPPAKKSGRLQKMISKITLNGDSTKTPRKMTVGSSDAPSRSMTNLSPLANRPIPPRYPVSGPPSATSSERGSGDQDVISTRQRAQSYVRKPVPAWDGKSVEMEVPMPSAPSLSPGMENISFTTDVHVPETMLPMGTSENDTGNPAQSARPPPTPNPPPPSATSIRVDTSNSAPTIQVPERISSKASSPLRPKLPPAAPQTPSIPPSLFEHAHEMRRMLARATSADECRILVDMFLTRSKLVTDAKELRALAVTPLQDSGNTELEKSIVGLFLGDSEPDTQHQLSSLNRRSAEPAEKQFETVKASPSITMPHGTTEVTDSH